MSWPARQKNQAPVLTIWNNCLVLRCRYEDRHLAKEIPGYRWNNKNKCWEYPLQPKVYQQIKNKFQNVKVDSRAEREIRRIAEGKKEVHQVKQKGPEAAAGIKLPSKTEGYAHQKLAWKVATTLPAAALLMEQGCGKSKVAVDTCSYRFKENGLRRVLIVAPTSVVPVWSEEFEKHCIEPYEIRVLQGPVKNRIKELLEKPWPEDKLQVAVINYESTWRMEDSLKKWQPQMIVADESQRIKTPGSKQSKTMHKLGKIADFKLILTGTPVTLSPLDFYSQYKFLDPSIFGTRFSTFRDRYAIMGGYGGYEVVGYQNLPELVQKTHSIAYRVTKEEALDLPDWVDQKMYCELSSKSRKIYDNLLDESLAELESGEEVTAVNVLSRLLRLSQVTGGFVGTEEGVTYEVGNEKMGLLEDTVNDLLAQGKKAVIFARFVPEIKKICRFLDDTNIKHSAIFGETPQKERGQLVKTFQEDPECKVFVAQIQTAGLGITLTAADTAIFYSLDFSLANYEQAKARIHRVGQTNKVTYIHLLARNTVDKKIMEALASKKNIADEVVDNWKKYFKEEG